MTNGTLAFDTDIGGVTYRANSQLSLYSTGKVFAGALAQSTMIGAFTYKALTEIKTNDTASGKVILTLPKVSIFFSETGTVLEGVLDGDQTVANYPLRGSISFNKNGSPKSVTLASDYSQGSITFKQYSQLSFHPSGNIASGTILSEMSIDGNSKIISASARDNYNLILKPNSIIELYESGNIKSGILMGMSVNNPAAQPGVVKIGSQILAFKKGSKMTFFENGKVKSAVIDADGKIQGSKVQKWDDVEFDESGNLTMVDSKPVK